MGPFAENIIVVEGTKLIGPSIAKVSDLVTLYPRRIGNKINKTSKTNIIKSNIIWFQILN